jgi:hypothetical protein
MKKVITYFLLILPFFSFGQDEAKKSLFFNKNVKRKGSLYVYWGYNREQFTNCDITFKGQDYDFVLKDVKASDQPEAFDFAEYFGPSSVSIPQSNIGLGYYINDWLSVSFNEDHMKYVVDNDQIVKITGKIGTAASSTYAGTYNNADIQTGGKFLRFAHTDGLNYLHLEAAATHQIFGTRKGEIALEAMFGLGLGVMVPATHVILLDYAENDKFHLSGYGIHNRLAMNLTFFNRIYIQANLKSGYTNLPNVIVRESGSDRASHNFCFLQQNIVVGYIFRLPFLKK